MCKISIVGNSCLGALYPVDRPDKQTLSPACNFECWNWGCFPEAEGSSHGDASTRCGWSFKAVCPADWCFRVRTWGCPQPSWSSGRGTPYCLCKQKTTAQRDKVFHYWKGMLGYCMGPQVLPCLPLICDPDWSPTLGLAAADEKLKLSTNLMGFNNPTILSDDGTSSRNR